MTRKSFALWNRAGPVKANDDQPEIADPKAEKDRGLWRDLTAYWFLGLCNNFGYVVMLTAAVDIIKDLSGERNSTDEDGNTIKGVRVCNAVSTGAILLADVVPSLMIKTLSPFLPWFVKIRIGICCLLSALGFVLVAVAEKEWLALLGIAITSLSSGLGEPTFLGHSTGYDRNVISTWSSGTGGAGIVGAISYALLRAVGLNNQQTLLTMVAVPVLEGIMFFGLLRAPKPLEDRLAEQKISEQEMDNVEENVEPLIGFKQKIKYIPSLFIFMIPLSLVYLLEYFINQGLFELVFFPDIFLDGSEQYRWYQVTYQIGVFISRSSVNIVQFKHIWIMAVLQFFNVIFFSFEAIYMFTPSIWIILGLILFEGLLGGGAYVNTFYRMSKEIPTVRRAFAIGVVALADGIGITLAGFLAMPMHNWVCGLDAPNRLH